MMTMPLFIRKIAGASLRSAPLEQEQFSEGKVEQERSPRGNDLGGVRVDPPALYKQPENQLCRDQPQEANRGESGEFHASIRDVSVTEDDPYAKPVSDGQAAAEADSGGDRPASARSQASRIDKEVRS
jgi:hypothetical protein